MRESNTRFQGTSLAGYHYINPASVRPQGIEPRPPAPNWTGVLLTPQADVDFFRSAASATTDSALKEYSLFKERSRPRNPNGVRRHGTCPKSGEIKNQSNKKPRSLVGLGVPLISLRESTRTRHPVMGVRGSTTVKVGRCVGVTSATTRLASVLLIVMLRDVFIEIPKSLSRHFAATEQTLYRLFP